MEENNRSDDDVFSFSLALDFLKKGRKVSRMGWNGKGLFITAQFPDEHSKMTKPYLYITTPVGSTNQFGSVNETEQRIPWLASQTDLMSNDWQLIK
jgi:hypothetical protein